MPGSIKIETVPALYFTENQRNEVDSRPNQQRQPSARPVAQSRSPRRDSITVVVQLAEGDVAIEPLSLRIVAQRLDHGDGIGPGLGHLGKPAADIVRFVQHITIMASRRKSCNARLVDFRWLVDYA